MTRLLSLALLIGIAVGGTALYSKFYRSDSGQDRFRVEKVTRGDLQINVRATGTVEPEETVDVGASCRPDQRPRERPARQHGKEFCDETGWLRNARRAGYRAGQLRTGKC